MPRAEPEGAHSWLPPPGPWLMDLKRCVGQSQLPQLPAALRLLPAATAPGSFCRRAALHGAEGRGKAEQQERP